MWQRIQTVYMALVAVLCVAVLVISSFSVVSLITVLIAILALVNLFLYKKRLIQVKINVINMLLALIYYGVFFLMIFINKTECQYNISFVFPAVSIIFSYLANRGIKKDDALVKSLNRIR